MFLCVHISDAIHLHTSTCYINCSRNSYNMPQVDIWICKNMQKSSNSWPIFIFHMDHTCVQKMVYGEPLLARSEGPLVLFAPLIDLPATVGWLSWALANGTIALSGNCWDSGHPKMSCSIFKHYLFIIQYHSYLFITDDWIYWIKAMHATNILGQIFCTTIPAYPKVVKSSQERKDADGEMQQTGEVVHKQQRWGQYLPTNAMMYAQPYLYWVGSSPANFSAHRAKHLMLVSAPKQITRKFWWLSKKPGLAWSLLHIATIHIHLCNSSTAFKVWPSSGGI